MIAAVVLPMVLQLLLPLALIGWVAFGRHRYRARWWLLIAIAWTWIAAIAVAGLWLALPWYLYLVHAGLLAAAMLSTWRREVPLPLLPQSRIARLGAALLLIVLLGAGVVVTWAIDGRRAPDAAVEASFPLRGGTYLVANGGRNSLVNAHTATLDTLSRFRPWRGQSHGIDLVKLGPGGLRARGVLPRDPARYAIFGDPVHAPCSGSVVQATDGIEDQPVPEVNRTRMAGNHVIVGCNGVWIVVAHLRRGSVRVGAGDAVETGTIVGEVGNSGNSNEPHLHIHAQRPGSADEPLGGDPLPVRFDSKYLARNQRITRTDGIVR